MEKHEKVIGFIGDDSLPTTEADTEALIAETKTAISLISEKIERLNQEKVTLTEPRPIGEWTAENLDKMLANYFAVTLRGHQLMFELQLLDDMLKESEVRLRKLIRWSQPDQTLN